MEQFTYITAANENDALSARAAGASIAYLAGGTTLIDLMKLGVEAPSRVVDIHRLPLDKIEPTANGGVRIGAMVRNSDLAHDANIRQNYPVLSQAILSGASPQLRNMATTGGNLMQRTRCYYFRDISYPCNKRSPGQGCAALTGYNRIHAILGTSDQCIATHPSDMCVAMSVLDAIIHLRDPGGTERSVSLNQFYIPYGQDPAAETVLRPGELITAVELPPPGFFARSYYLKIRDRAEYEFALASAAVAMDMAGGLIREARVALGGVATKPWRATEAEKVLKGAKASEDTFAAAADAELKSAQPRTFNAFKVKLCRETILRALQTTAQMA